VRLSSPRARKARDIDVLSGDRMRR